MIALRIFAIVVGTTTCLALAACGQDGSLSESDPQAAGIADRAVAAPSMAVKAQADLSGAPESSPEPAPSVGQEGPTAVTDMIIRNGFANIQVDSLELAMAAARALAARVGGTVGNTSVEAGDRQVRRANMQLRIPSARFDEVMGGLAPLGKVESVNATAQDVGEEFVDVSARVANARRLEERLITILATRTGKLEEVLAVERELARVREEIDRYEGRIRYLKSRVAISTLELSLHEKEPLAGTSPGSNVLVEAFVNAWRNFVHFVAGFIAILGYLIPLGVLVAIGFVAWRTLRRR